jgi:hypothetical protein
VSDIQDLIHKTTMDCLERGRREEQQRIIKLIEPLGCPANGIEHHCENNLALYTADDLIALIKGEK